jgi:hypothetical protein
MIKPDSGILPRKLEGGDLEVRDLGLLKSRARRSAKFD